MSDIRPPLWSQAPGTPGVAARPAPDAARIAAQKAFFEAALGRSSAPQPPTPAAQARPAAPAIHVTELRPVPTQTDEPPQRIPRPGSFLNILV